MQRFFCAVLLYCLADPTGSLIADDDGPSYVKNNSLVVVRTGDGTNTYANTYAAHSKHTGTWTQYTFPEGVAVTPVAGNNHVAFQLRSSTVRELVAVDKKGAWRKHHLVEFVKGTCTPVVAENLAIYQIGNRTYAFSGITGTWDSISRASPAKSTADHGSPPKLSPDRAIVVTADRISIFSAQSGSWATSPRLLPAEQRRSDERNIAPESR